MTTPTREQVVQFSTDAGAYLYADTICYGEKNCDDFATALVTLARADLEATVKEQAAEIERLNRVEGILEAFHRGYVEQADAYSENIRQQLRKANAEIDRLFKLARIEKIASDNCEHKEEADQLRQQLVAAQLHIEQLNTEISNKDALVSNWWSNLPDTFCSAWNEIDSLSTQPDLSALESERQRVAEACAVYVKSGNHDDDPYIIAEGLLNKEWKKYYQKE